MQLYPLLHQRSRTQLARFAADVDLLSVRELFGEAVTGADGRTRTGTGCPCGF